MSDSNETLKKKFEKLYIIWTEEMSLSDEEGTLYFEDWTTGETIFRHYGDYEIAISENKFDTFYERLETKFINEYKGEYDFLNLINDDFDPNTQPFVAKYSLCFEMNKFLEEHWKEIIKDVGTKYELLYDSDKANTKRIKIINDLEKEQDKGVDR